MANIVYCRFSISPFSPDGFTNIAIDESGRFYTVDSGVIESRLTPSQLADYRQCEAEYAGYAAYAAEFGDPPQPEPRFATLADCVAYIDVHEYANGIADDMRAFNAPSECYADAYRGVEKRIAECEARAVAWV